LQAAILAWGPKGNRGSKVDYTNLKAAANVVRNDMRMLADYVQNTRPDDPDTWILAGFEVKDPRTAPQPLTIVRDLHFFISKFLDAGTIKIKWKRPEFAGPGDVKVYIVLHNDTPTIPLYKGGRGIVNVMGITTDTQLTFTPPYVGANYFWVIPYNAAGPGVISDVMQYNNPGKI
jgi:hypothetical protein